MGSEARDGRTRFGPTEWDADRVATTTTETSPPAAALVGRRPELEALHAALRELEAGRGRMVFLTGEPGIGKTRLATEIAHTAHARGVRILWGRCWEGGGAEEYWPWKRALRHYVRGASDAELATQLGSGASYVARLVPELAARLEPERDRAVSMIPDVDGVRFALFDAVAAFLQSVAADRPLMIVLDDLHAADLPSLMLLRFVARELHDAPILLLGTFRDGQARIVPEIGDLLAALGREARTLGLQRFSPEEVGEYIRGATDLVASAAAVRAIHSATEGNPFFVDEIVRLMASQGELAAFDGGTAPGLVIPDGVRAAIRERLSRLPPATLEILRLAAVAGREFARRTLHAAWNPSDAAAGRLAEFDERVQPALLSDVLLPTSASGERLAFRHGLIRDTLYDDLGARQRTRLHRRIAAALERRDRLAADVPPGELAHHFALGAEDNEDRRAAVRLMFRAAAQAVDRFAFEAARDRLDDALSLLADLPGEPALRIEALLGLADVSMRLGTPEVSRRHCFAAAEIARAHDLAPLLARAAIGFGWHFDASAVDYERIALLEEACTRVGEEEPALRARLLARLAQHLYHVTSADGRREHLSDEAVELARRHGEAPTLAFALNARLFTLWRPALAGTRLEQARELLRLAEASGERELELQSRQWIVGSLLELGQLGAATAEMVAYRQRASQLRQPLYLWFAANWDVMRAMLDGRLDEVEALAEVAYAVGARAEPENAASTHAAQTFALRWLQGRLGEIAPAMQAFAADSPHADRWRRAVVLLHEQTGDLELARRELEIACPSNADALHANRLSMQTDLCILVDACHRLRDRPRAALIYEALAPHADRLVILGLGVATFGCVSQYLGVLSATLERWDEADYHFTAAVAMHRRLGARAFLAMTLCGMGEMYTARGDSVAARRALDEALALSLEVGMPHIERRARGGAI